MTVVTDDVTFLYLCIQHRLFTTNQACDLGFLSSRITVVER